MPRTKSDNKTITTATKTTKVAKTAKSTKKEAIKATPVTQVTPDTTATIKTESADTIFDDFTKLLSNLQQINSCITSLKADIRQLEKRAHRELKEAKKLGSKRSRVSSANRQPSGFVKPTKISTELAAFLGKPKDTEMARTEVTREINAYIRAHKLQDPSNGRKINADRKLATLLKLKKDDELTYFNLQRFMSCHFAKASTSQA